MLLVSVQLTCSPYQHHPGIEYVDVAPLIFYRAFTGIYHDKKDPGIYRCIVCHKELFNASKKYNSGSGWPSFYDVIDEANVKKIVDTSHGMHRVEVVCAHVSIIDQILGDT